MRICQSTSFLASSRALLVRLIATHQLLQLHTMTSGHRQHADGRKRQSKSSAVPRHFSRAAFSATPDVPKRALKSFSTSLKSTPCMALEVRDVDTALEQDLRQLASFALLYWHWPHRLTHTHSHAVAVQMCKATCQPPAIT